MNPTSPQDTEKVWQDLDQAALDRAYDQTQWARNIADVMGRCAAHSQTLREARGLPQRLAYGSGAREQLDFFRCGQAPAPLMVFVHGGAWRSGAAQDYAFVAGPWLDAGMHVAVVDFDAVQDCSGELLTLANQVRCAVLWLQAQAAQLGVDRAQIHLTGHSSGAHLAAAVAVGDARSWPPLALRSLSCVSGMYELEPVRRSARSRYVAFTEDSVQRLSPARQAKHQPCPTLIAHGSLESPQFQWQAQAFAQALSEGGKQVQSLVMPDLNHFEILEAMGDAAHPLTRAMLALARG